ncbi:hypothetical protein JCM4814A_82040 [Streptomyces phaeofaciens JCM 4814]|uniref:Uncharacterized protein n=1 Tax=Streptomyces phaeofaciens TaxID=68254 RepID=A0A918HPT1_9ACTN|nr:hypothetical protein GCM10010226_80060 [Streptomyces phaeofaciens]
MLHRYDEALAEAHRLPRHGTTAGPHPGGRAQQRPHDRPPRRTRCRRADPARIRELSADGGHGTIVRLAIGDLALTLHQPSDSPDERAVVRPLVEGATTITIKESSSPA